MKSQNELPLVTVGVAIYNHESFIRQCILSVLGQSYPNIELIMVDDGSSDNSYRVASQTIETSGHKHRISLTTRENRGMCRTLNEIAHQANGSYISFLGSDDYWLPGKINDQVHYLEHHQDKALVHSNSIRVDAENIPGKTIDYSRKDNCGFLHEALIRRTGGINTPSHLYRTAVFSKIGYYDPQFRFEDTDFWLRLTRHYSVGFINTIHTCYRWHGGNLSQDENQLLFYLDELIAVYRKNIKDPELLRYGIRRTARKGILKALKAGSWNQIARFSREWRNC